jgi:hypothetical protein
MTSGFFVIAAAIKARPLQATEHHPVTLKPLTATCTPRKDVLDGQFGSVDFAAKLEQVVSDPGSYEDYGNPDLFFGLTHPTGGMKRLMTGVFGRLSGQSVPGAENPVVRFQTSFGGGKTHGLIGLYHVANGHRPGPAFFDGGFDESKLSDDMQVAAVVGEQLDPINGAEFNGHSARTLWGAIAAQIGDDAWKEMAKSDASATPPGTGTIKKMLGGKPTVIIIDEVAHHLRSLATSGDEQVRAMAGSVPAFFKALFEVAAEKGSGLVVVITLATDQDAFGAETDQVEVLLDKTLKEAGSVLARQEAVLVPAKDDEIALILKRRLFETVDPAASSAAGDAFRAMYEQMVEAGETLPSGASHPTSYGEKVALSYPFHPELVRVLDSRIATIPTFQRARGALRLLAASIHDLWSTGSDAVILNVADVPLSAEKVLYELTDRLGKHRFRQPAQVDIALSDAHAIELDGARFGGKPFATRAATTVFLHSLEQVSVVGAGRGDYLLGSLRPGDQAEIYDEALNSLWDKAWHLSFDNVRWRFQIEANARAVVADEATNLPKSQVTEEMERKIRQAFAGVGGKVVVVHEPTGPSDIADEARLNLVVGHPDDTAMHVTDPQSPLPAPSKLIQLASAAGVSGNNRRHRNAVVFLCVDPNQVEPLKHTIRQHMAAARILDSETRRQDLGLEVVKQIQQIKDAGDIEVAIAVSRCFSHLYIPAPDTANDNLRHEEVPAKSKGDIKGKGQSQTEGVLDILRSFGKIKASDPALAPSYLKSKTWAKEDEITLDKVRDWFWVDPALEMPIDETRITDSVRTGVKNGEWVYYDAGAERGYTDADAPPPVKIASDTYLMTPERAAETGAIKPKLSAVVIAELISKAGGTIAGTDLYDQLEEEVGKRPHKKDVTAILQRVAAKPGSQIAVVEGSPEEGKAQLTESQLGKVSHDRVTLLSRKAAEHAGIVATSSSGGPKVVADTGPAAVAFNKVREKATEVTGAIGVASISVKATADAGEGVSDIRALGAVIGMTPKLDITIDLSLGVTLAHGDAEVELDGPSGHYQKLESDLLKFASHGDEVSGYLQLNARSKDGTPIDPSGPDWQALASNTANLDPGQVEVEVEVVTEDS